MPVIWTRVSPRLVGTHNTRTSYAVYAKSEHRLSKHADESVAAVFAGAGVGQSLARHLRQSERAVEFSIGEQASVGGDDRATKLKHQASVEIEPESLTIADSTVDYLIDDFTRVINPR